MFSILLLIDNNLEVKGNYKIKSEFYLAFNYEPLYSTREGTPRKKNQNPYSIDHQNLRFSVPYLCLDQKFDNLFTTIATDTVALNISFEALLFMVLSIMMKK